MKVAVIIPALNEASSIGRLVREVWEQLVDQVIVVDNGSTDGTADAACGAGAMVVREPRRGYGYACAAGAAASHDFDVLVFIDGDHSFLPQEIPAILRPLEQDLADLVLGSRRLGRILPRSMPFHQRFGNRLAAGLLRVLYGLPVTDLGPFRAIKDELLGSLPMKEMTFGWPLEMIVKAARRQARIMEVPVTYQARHGGQSKVSGTLRGTIMTAYRIFAVTFRNLR